MLSYYKLDVSLKPSSITPLPFIGSTLRGAFGVSLKSVVCINPSYECKGCFAKDNCIYYDFYETKNKAHKYRFDFELNPKNYNFSLYIFEDATQKLPYIVSALYKMLTKTGLGVNRDKFKIDKISCNNKIIYENDKFNLHDIKTKKFTAKNLSSNIKIKLKTPLRIKYQNRLLNKKPSLEHLLYSIQNRLHEIKDEPKIKLTFTPSYKEKLHDIKFKDLTRRSNRQKTKLQIGGIIGEISYNDVDEKSVILLKLGEILGVGKQTVFGMGKIEVEGIKNERGEDERY